MKLKILSFLLFICVCNLSIANELNFSDICQMKKNYKEGYLFCKNKLKTVYVVDNINNFYIKSNNYQNFSEKIIEKLNHIDAAVKEYNFNVKNKNNINNLPLNSKNTLYLISFISAPNINKNIELNIMIVLDGFVNYKKYDINISDLQSQDQYLEKVISVYFDFLNSNLVSK